VDETKPFDQSSDDFRFSAAVAAFGLKLCHSEYINDFRYDQIERIAAGALGSDPGGHRAEFTGLVRQAETLSAALTN